MLLPVDKFEAIDAPIDLKQIGEYRYRIPHTARFAVIKVCKASKTIQEEKPYFDSAIRNGEEVFFQNGTYIEDVTYHIWCDDKGNVFENQRYFQNAY